MAKAPSLWEDGSKGTQRTRELSTGNAPWSWRNVNRRFMDVPWRWTKGAEPDVVKATSPVLNGEDEETGRRALRLVLTQLPRFRFRQQLTPSVRLLWKEEGQHEADWRRSSCGAAPSGAASRSS